MFKKLMLSGIGFALLAGCASGLNSVENRRYMAYEQDNVLVKEKNPTAGAWLGLLPGGGSFRAYPVHCQSCCRVSPLAIVERFIGRG